MVGRLVVYAFAVTIVLLVYDRLTYPIITPDAIYLAKEVMPYIVRFANWCAWFLIVVLLYVLFFEQRKKHGTGDSHHHAHGERSGQPPGSDQ